MDAAFNLLTLDEFGGAFEHLSFWRTPTTPRWLYDYLTCLHWSLCQFTPASMEVQFLGRFESCREWLGKGGWCPVFVRELSSRGRFLFPSTFELSCHASHKMHTSYQCIWFCCGKFAAISASCRPVAGGLPIRWSGPLLRWRCFLLWLLLGSKNRVIDSPCRIRRRYRVFCLIIFTKHFRELKWRVLTITKLYGYGTSILGNYLKMLVIFSPFTSSKAALDS